MEIIKATTLQKWEAIEELAREILPDHYGSFLPLSHVLFFIEKFQTAKAIELQIQNGFEYYLMEESGKYIAYLGIEKIDPILVLSKIYVHKTQQGKGIGQQLMNLVYERAEALNLLTIELLVVNDNAQAIKFYQKEGFEIAEEIVKEYENGYAVTEYKMRKIIKKKNSF